MAKTSKLTIYPSEHLRARIAAIAEAEHRSENQQVLLWVEQGLNGQGPEPSVVQPSLPPPAADDALGTPVRPAPALAHGDRLRRRTTSCHHLKRPDEYCEVCDA